MSAPHTRRFLENLRATGLLGEAQLAEIESWPSAASGHDHALAEELVRRELLTRFQADYILGGHTHLLVGSYAVMDRLGSGGMARVYKAVDRRTRRIVAIKSLRPSLRSDPEARARFLREGRAAARLCHPHIVACYEVIEQSEGAYLVMEYVRGPSVSSLIADHGRLRPGHAARLAREVALALEHARQQGVVHRDVKPSNILTDARGSAKLMDLGLARIGGTVGEKRLSKTLTFEGAVVGTIDYVAPEQIRDCHRADTRADIYSLGCTLYHMLAGRVPFAGTTGMERLAERLSDEPALPGELASDVAPGLAEVVATMMAKRLAARYQTPGEVVEALVPWADPPVNRADSGRSAPGANPLDPGAKHTQNGRHVVDR